MKTILSSKTKEVVIERGKGTVIIGERINPTGKKALAQALLNGDLEVLRQEAIRQIEAGAEVLEVNVGAAGVDEVAVLPAAVKIVAEVSYLPLSIDSSNPDALAAALEVYEGKALVNSVTGEEHSLVKVLPLIKKYNAAVIGLCMDDNGIPEDVEGRVKIATKIIERATEIGIPQEDIIIDCLAMTVSSNTQAAVITLETLAAVRDKLGNNTVLGASNVSFGLPERKCIHLAFFPMVIHEGLSAIIADPTVQPIRRVIRASDLLMGYDEWATNYLKDYREYGPTI
ncbi:5-methyltetrahydrofolate:corrinoid/iron-sulfur protein co-methyltransferase [Neomoorella glycerini]|uniref:5-methyltetrahydrofolate:corrinoid/iron-sulfur protein co-methyltransferase n=1 Tax=Neomoorella glycerini TaxID=55779 RepID=A0A6I5ZPC6_9FIRM|nr:dihydropteroate synthase [Moorella glycerini]QGP91626.1 5-methyltetrahydrofolate:corrinoid/iron-sulfur protein co-methyltransferase [Moorella glycerini]